MKLVRDKIPDMIMKKEKSVQMRVADSAEYDLFLIKKLKEEVEEFIDDRNIEEMADIEEVLRCYAEQKGIDWSQVEALRQKKSEEKGSFKKRIIIEMVEDEKKSD
ncbi:MAG TPA: nucleoside triphosphate pyrophosphohydrolase [archaeon]|nr:nucleoside triphosphate pyrophosphohydrolase [archaeon]